MPIEIREIVIRATVNEQGSGGGNASHGVTAASPAGGGGDVIQECIEQVMQIIQDKETR